jgi:hypothetical protein
MTVGELKKSAYNRLRAVKNFGGKSIIRLNFCPLCDEEIPTGWGNRTECPHCEKMVTTIRCSVNYLKRAEA